MIKEEILICECYSVEHQIIFRYDSEDNMVYLSTHLNKRSFWSRLKYGIKYIFGRKSNYGAFDEFIINPKDVGKLEKIVKHLKNIGYGY